MFDRQTQGRTTAAKVQRRLSKRQKIRNYFRDHIGVPIGSYSLHGMFGGAVRTRISEINRDPDSPITIKNEVTFRDGEECSLYWAELKPATPATKRKCDAVPVGSVPESETFPEFGSLTKESGVD
jgi:hypothetical protein